MMAEAVRYRLLDEPLLSVSDAAGRRVERLSLPALYAALVRDAVGDFPAVRPHQRHVWHAFLVQVGALALHQAGLAEPPDEAAAWRELLLALTPDDPDGAAWALVAPPVRPALLQAPVPGGDVSKFDRVQTPDALDVLVLSKSHDLKSAVMSAARPEHWVYSLVSLQTQQGYSGGGGTLKGISRMNGGGGSRAGFGIEPGGGAGRRFARDLRVLRESRQAILAEFPDRYMATGGIGLVWLEPWDGTRSIAPERLDPFYVEICRRVRLTSDRVGVIHGLTKPAGKSVARIDTERIGGGRTGDAWAPTVAEGDQKQRVVYTAPKQPFGYARLVRLLFPVSTNADSVQRAPMQCVQEFDDEQDLTLGARVLVRDRMKTGTFGYHERRVPVTKVTRRFFTYVASDEGAKVATDRVEDVGLFSEKVLYPAVLAAYTAAPSAGERGRADDTAKWRTKLMLDRFDVSVDTSFFADLDAELALLGDPEAQEQERGRWLLRLRDLGRAVLKEVLDSAPTAAMRHHRTRVRARRRFESAFRHHFGARVPAGA